MTERNTHDPVLVVGGRGKTGRRVVERLRARDVPVRVGSRFGDTRFDWEDEATWAPALRTAAAAYVTYYPDIAVPGASDRVGQFIDLALGLGTRRLVLLTGRGEEEAQLCEKQLMDSGADWTVLRCSWFNQNFSESFLVDPVLAGAVMLPAGNVPEPFIDTDDVADVATIALTEDGHVGQLYELTGPRALGFAEAVATIAEAVGREIVYADIPVEEFAAGLGAEGVPDDLVEFLAYLFTTVLDGRNTDVCDGVERVLGRPARDFADYTRAAAATGVWNPGSPR